MNTLIENQNKIFDNAYAIENIEQYNFHITDDKFMRFLRDRRLNIAYDYLCKAFGKAEVKTFSFLIVCGGVGGEAFFFENKGCKNVTNSDFSQNSLTISKKLFKNIFISLQNAEDLSFESGQFDVVLVQDGLHHLPRPVLGFTEMLRVANKAAIVIEPYNGLVGAAIGTEWEEHEEIINYVFRWDRKFFSQITKSYLLKNYKQIKVFRIWDHNVVIRKLGKIAPTKFKVVFSKFVYSILSFFDFSGNMFIGIVIKN